MFIERRRERKKARQGKKERRKEDKKKGKKEHKKERSIKKREKLCHNGNGTQSMSLAWEDPGLEDMNYARSKQAGISFAWETGEVWEGK